MVLTEAVLRHQVQAGLRTIAFVKVRTVAEIVLKRCRQLLPPELRAMVASYRSGYLAGAVPHNMDYPPTTWP